jgi:hypothetical protein
MLLEVVRRNLDPLDADFRASLRDRTELYRTGSTPEEKLRAKQELEKIREEVLVDLRERLKVWEALKERLRIENERVSRDPRTAQGYARFDVETAAAEQQADALLKKRIDLDEDDCIFCDGKIWPGPEDPGQPFPNPVREEDRRKRLVLQILARRAQQKELEVLVGGSDPRDPAAFYDRVMETYNFRKFHAPTEAPGAQNRPPSGSRQRGGPGPRPNPPSRKPAN